MNPADHITEDDLILLALQFLPEKELPDALAHVAHCDMCRQELGSLQGGLAAYAMTAEMHSPPAYARERLLRQISKEKKLLYIRHGGSMVQAVNSDGVYELGKPSRTATLAPWAGWAVAAAMTAVAALQFVSHQHTRSALQDEITQMNTKTARAQEVLETLTDSRAQQVGIHLASAAAGAKAAPDAHAAYMPDKGSLVFFASRLEPLQPYKTYELWLLPANGREPIAAGVFKPDSNGNANVVMPNLPKGVPASGFGVTIEDEGGAKQPTLPIVMSGS